MAIPVVQPIADILVEPFFAPVITANATDPDGSVVTYTFRQISGTTINLTGTGNNRTFIVPARREFFDIVVGVTATDAQGEVSSEVSVNIRVLPVTEWAVVNGIQVPMRIYRVQYDGVINSEPETFDATYPSTTLFPGADVFLGTTSGSNGFPNPALFPSSGVYPQ